MKKVLNFPQKLDEQEKVKDTPHGMSRGMGLGVVLGNSKIVLFAVVERITKIYFD